MKTVGKWQQELRLHFDHASLPFLHSVPGNDTGAGVRKILSSNPGSDIDPSLIFSKSLALLKL